MDAESMKVVGRWAGKTVALMSIAVEQVLRDEEVDLSRWRPVVQEYEDICLLVEREQVDQLRARLTNLGALARSLAAVELEEAGRFSETIKEDSDFDLTRLFAKCVIAKRYADAFGATQPNRFAEHAESLNSLVPFSGNRETTQQALSHVVRLFASAVKGFAAQNELRKALQPCTNLVGLANELVIHFNVSDFLADALCWGERLIAAFPEPDPESSSSLVVVAHNLINTCSLLAREAESSEEFFVKQKDFALYGLRVIPNLTRRDEVLPHLHEGLLRGLILGVVNLGLAKPNAFEQHIRTAWTYYSQYQQLVDSWGDPDAQQRCIELKLQILQWLHEKKPGWSEFVPEEPHLELPDANRAAEELARLRNETDATIESIRSLPQDEQLEAIGAAIEETYKEIEENLLPVVNELGLNHHACRFFLALGAIADGRLGKLIVNASFNWLLSPERDGEMPRGYRRGVRRRQQLPAMTHMVQEIISIAAIYKLAALTQIDCAKCESIKLALRNQNVRLLSSLIPATARVNHVDRREQIARDDLMKALRSIPYTCWRQAWARYSKAMSLNN